MSPHTHTHTTHPGCGRGSCRQSYSEPSTTSSASQMSLLEFFVEPDAKIKVMNSRTPVLLLVIVSKEDKDWCDS